MTQIDARPPETGARKADFLVWTAVLIGIGAWMAHAVAQSALAQFVCTEREYEWVLHAATVVAAAPVVWAIVFCWRLAKESPEGEDSGSPVGRNRFLGLFGLILNAVNLVLILVEGTYAVFIKNCA